MRGKRKQKEIAETVDEDDPPLVSLAKKVPSADFGAKVEDLFADDKENAATEGAGPFDHVTVEDENQVEENQDQADTAEGEEGEPAATAHGAPEAAKTVTEFQDSKGTVQLLVHDMELYLKSNKACKGRKKAKKEVLFALPKQGKVERIGSDQEPNFVWDVKKTMKVLYNDAVISKGDLLKQKKVEKIYGFDYSVKSQKVVGPAKNEDGEVSWYGTEPFSNLLGNIQKHTPKLAMLPKSDTGRLMIEGNLEDKRLTMWTDEKQR